MRAIILAAGRGSRLKSLTNEKPKCMLKFDGQTLISRQIQAIQQAMPGDDIAVVGGYLHEKIQAQGITKRFMNHQWETTNMVVSLISAEEWLNSDTCIVSYGDIFYESTAIASLRQSQSDIAITYDINYLTLWQKRFAQPLDDLETFKLDATSYLTEIGKKPQTLDDIQGQYMGLLKFTPTGWQIIKHLLTELTPGQLSKLDMTSMLNLALQHGVRIEAIPYHDSWGEIDHESDLALYETALSRA